MKNHIDLNMKWLGAAGWLFEWGAQIIVVDPFFQRPPNAKPFLPIKLGDLPSIDYLLTTHAHWDHFVDIPYLAVTNARQTYVPKAVLPALRKQWRKTPTNLRKRGKENWKGVVGGECIQLPGLKISFHHIGTEKFDLATARDIYRRLKGSGVGWDNFDVQILFPSYLFGKCFAIALEMTQRGQTMIIFGNLTQKTGDLHSVHPKIDLAVLPYCPANEHWLEDSVFLANHLEPTFVLVHHFDQFFPPVTVGLDMPGYVSILERKSGIQSVRLPKFFKNFMFNDLM